MSLLASRPGNVSGVVAFAESSVQTLTIPWGTEEREIPDAGNDIAVSDFLPAHSSLSFTLPALFGTGTYASLPLPEALNPPPESLDHE
jgi:hypothetical protein